MRLQGKTALITGASRNIGRAIALAFATEGADLVVNTRTNRDGLEGVATECRKAGVRVVPVLGDIADAGAVDSMVRQGLAPSWEVSTSSSATRPSGRTRRSPKRHWRTGTA